MPTGSRCAQPSCGPTSGAIAEAELLADRCGEAQVYRTTGTRVTPSCSAAKFLWIQRHQPEIYDRTHALSPGQGLRRVPADRRLCQSDYSDASNTNLFDLEARTWATDLVADSRAGSGQAAAALPVHGGHRPRDAGGGQPDRSAGRDAGGHRRRRRRVRHGGSGRGPSRRRLHQHRLVSLAGGHRAAAAPRPGDAHLQPGAPGPGACHGVGLDAGRRRRVRLAGASAARRS